MKMILIVDIVIQASPPHSNEADLSKWYTDAAIADFLSFDTGKMVLTKKNTTLAVTFKDSCK